MFPILERHLVGPEERRNQRGRAGGGVPDHLELLHLRVQREPVSRFHLHRGRAVRQETVHAHLQEPSQLIGRPLSHVAHRRKDAAPGGGDLLVPDPAGPALVIVEARRAKHGVGVGVHETRKQDPPNLLDIRVGKPRPQVTLRPNRQDRPVVVDGDGGPVDHVELRHLGAPPGAGRAATGDDLGGPEEQRAQP